MNTFKQIILSMTIAVGLCALFVYCGRGLWKNNAVEQKTLQPSDSSRYLKPVFEVTEEKDVLYREVENNKGQMEKLLLDVYQPLNDTETERPAIIWIHGGGFTTGSKDAGIEKELAVEFAKRGYVTFNINYRLREKPWDDWPGTFFDSTDDAAYALQWVLENSQKYRVDKKHVAFGGHSAGGSISINLNCREDIRDARWPKGSVFSVIDLAGGDIWMGTAHKSDPPCVIIHGTLDNIEPLSQSESFAQKLQNAGVSHELYKIEGAKHDLYGYLDEVTDVIARFLYKNLTGKDADIPIETFTEVIYEKEYRAKQINLKVDGNLDEWKGSEVISFKEIKDAGKDLPSSTDFSGTGMVGWNASDPGRVYIACVITDDVMQDIHTPDNLFWEDDCVEILFDMTDNVAKQRAPQISWALGANGSELSNAALPENTEWKLVRDGNRYIYEAALDLNKTKEQLYKTFKAKAGSSIGFSIAANDCENGVREHQLGWTSGYLWNARMVGKLVFDEALTK